MNFSTRIKRIPIYIKNMYLEYYNVGFIEQSISELIDKKNTPVIHWMKHSYKDRFFADPFLLDQDKNNYYILAEEYAYYDKKGRIVLLTVRKDDFSLINRQVYIDEISHLSFPFYYNGCIYPENYRSGKYYSYRLRTKEGSSYWEKREEISAPCIDPVIFNDGCTEWLFASFKPDAMGEEYLFYKENGQWCPHPLNPVKKDIKTSRSAGHFFTIGEELFRPVQDNEQNYGHCVRIMRVETLGKDAYYESEVCEINTEQEPYYNMGCHTFNVEEGVIIIDGYVKKHYFLRILRLQILKYIKQHFIKKTPEPSFNIVKV